MHWFGDKSPQENEEDHAAAEAAFNIMVRVGKSYAKAEIEVENLYEHRDALLKAKGISPRKFVLTRPTVTKTVTKTPAGKGKSNGEEDAGDKEDEKDEAEEGAKDRRSEMN